MNGLVLNSKIVVDPITKMEILPCHSVEVRQTLMKCLRPPLIQEAWRLPLPA